MPAASATRRPTVTFEVAVPDRVDALPRMDVAAFYGFADRGPIGVAVAVEDLRRFREVFGPDVVFGRDDRGRTATSHLGATVAGFFAAGGHRCHVTRLARAPRDTASTAGGAVRGRVALAGLAIPDTGSRPPLRLAQARVRWAGSSGLQVQASAAAERDPLALSAFVPAVDDAGGWTLELGGEVVDGDLLELRWPTETLLATATVVGRRDEAVHPITQVHLPAAGRRWSRATVPTTWGDPGRVEVLRTDGRRPVDVAGDLDAARGALRLRGPGAIALGTGDVLVVRFRTRWLLARVATAEGDLVDAPRMHVPLTERQAVGARPAPARRPRVSRLRLRLDGWLSGVPAGSVGDLGFDPRHPRFWAAALPVDEDHFLLTPGAPPPATPLAAPAPDPRGPHPAAVPLLLDADGGALGAQPAVPPARARRARLAGDPDPLHADGLSPGGLALFGDPDLLRAGASGLSAVLRARAAGDARTGLRGVTAVALLEEATLVAVPDAVHAGWRRTTERLPAPLDAPALAAPGRTGRRVTLSWSAVPGADGYRVELLDRRTGDAPRLRRDVPGRRTALELDLPLLCGDEPAVRVRAVRAGEPGPASSTRCIPADTGTFTDEATVPLVVALAAERGSGGRWRLQWRVEPDAPLAAVAEVQLSTDHDFAGDRWPAGSASGAADGEVEIEAAAGRVTYARLRVRSDAGGPPSAWSNVVVLSPPERLVWSPPSSSAPPLLQAVHRHLLALCGLRGDLLALLALPRDATAGDVERHLAALTDPTAPAEQVPALDPDDLALAQGAVHHPWAVTREGAAHPAAGHVAGLLAAEALEGRPWVAPAGRALPGVVAPSRAADVGRLAAARANPLDGDPLGVVALGARTLAPDGPGDRIALRRLAAVLRRVAASEGAVAAFEPAGERLRDLLTDRFDALLTELYLRGALRGADAREAFEVRVDTSRALLDRGVVLVDVVVAPARPLERLVVRLRHAGAGPVRIEELR